jgi:hypothetical protein
MMEGLHKIALNAMKAREMASAAGLHPFGNWKWALRNLRDNRGNLMQGRELSEAKEGLGKLPNNVRQKVQSVARMAGNNKEIGMAATESTPLTRFSDRKFDRNTIKGETTVRGVKIGDEEGVRLYEDFIDSGHPYNADNYKDVGMITHDVHTHPLTTALRHMDPTKKIEKMKTTYPELAADPTKKTLFSRQRKNYEDAKAKGSPGPGLVVPSGQLGAGANPGFYQKLFQRDPDEAIKSLANEEGGDYAVYNVKSFFNPTSKSTIYDPMHGNESVHVARPKGMRSVYFKNQGQYN